MFATDAVTHMKFVAHYDDSQHEVTGGTEGHGLALVYLLVTYCRPSAHDTHASQQ